MSKSSQYVDFKALKAAVTMEQVLAHYQLIDRLKRGKGSLTGPCPIHKGTNPDQFRVSLSKNCWNCFGDCHGGGNVLDFVAKMENVDLKEAARRMVVWFALEDLLKEKVAAPKSKTSGKTMPTAPKPDSPSKPTVNKPLGFALKLEPHHPYPEERGLTPETIAEFGLGFCAKGIMAGRIAIPIRNVKGELIGYAGRWAGTPPEGTPKYKLPAEFQKSLEVYRLAHALQEQPDHPLIIVEGFFGLMKLWQLGYRKCVALMGSSMSEVQEQLIANTLKPNSRVIVLFDEDDAGRTGRIDVAARLATKAFVRVVVFETEDFQPERLTLETAAALHLLS